MKPLPLTVLGVALLAASWWHGWHSKGDQLANQANNRQLQQARQALADYAAQTQRLATIADRVQQHTTRLASTSARQQQDYRRHAQTMPLPADCHLDAGRLQQLQTAIAIINHTITTAQPQPPAADH
ncbi:hypothetical protein [Aquitalea pelogenes]|uniref:hypothetical protein n=1 Tax=Aquitalea pelogenes TaxID=1293573 RepID=UPI0035B23FFC